jgi:hypothetical protein
MSGFSAGDTSLEASDVSFDPTGTGLAAATVYTALAELDGRGYFLRKKLVDTNVTVQAGYFAVWVRPRIAAGSKLRVAATAALRVFK